MNTALPQDLSQRQIAETTPSYNIIMAGESGVGKTAVINMIFDNVKLKTSSSAIGCTDECASVRGNPAEFSDLFLRIVDSIGLSESSEGTVPSQQAVEMLENKLNKLYTQDGIHLVLFCIKKGRQSQATSEHYKTIVHTLCENQVPCLLVITRCEDDEPLGEWWKDNENYIRKNLQFDVRDAVAVTTIKNEETIDDYVESRHRLVEAIKKYALQEPWRARNFTEKLSSFFKAHIIHTSKLQTKKRDPIQEKLQSPMTSSKTNKSIFSIFSFR